MAIQDSIQTEHGQQQIRVAVDNCIFTVKDGLLHILLIQMKEKLAGTWALPGGLVGNSETADDAAKRILKEQTAVDNVYLEQLYTFSDLDRDPFDRVLSVAYLALIPDSGPKLQTSSKYAGVQWWPVSKLPELAYDHTHIAEAAVARVRSKITYSNIVWSLLPDTFTLTDLQKVYEAILGSSLDKRNFRKKILKVQLIAPSDAKTADRAYRPAQLYRFTSKKTQIVDIL